MHDRWFDQYEIPVQTDRPAIKREIPIEIPLQRRNLLLCNACHEQLVCAYLIISDRGLRTRFEQYDVQKKL